MSRVDVPTLKCDRCSYTITNQTEMGHFQKLTQDRIEGRATWDLCPACWTLFQAFMEKRETNVES